MNRIARGWLIAASATFTLVGCQGQAPPGPPPPPPPAAVDAAPVVIETVRPARRYTGRIDATEQVQIRPRVSAYLQQVHVDDGVMVDAGELLYTLDSAPFAARVASAQADLALAEANLKLARSEAARGAKLVAARAGSAEELALREADVARSTAEVQAAQARLLQAELELGYTAISAPMAGRIGRTQIQAGNLVNAGSDVLAVLVSTADVDVVFAVDEPTWLDLSRNGQVLGATVGVVIGDREPRQATIHFVDNQLDPRTGTISLRARMDNTAGVLVPGLYAQVEVYGTQVNDAVLITDQAVLTDQDRRYVYVVGAGNSAERRDLRLGASIDGLRLVEAGLRADDRVVVAGMSKIFFPGAPLAVNDVQMRDVGRDPAAAPAAN